MNFQSLQNILEFKFKFKFGFDWALTRVTWLLTGTLTGMTTWHALIGGGARALTALTVPVDSRSGPLDLDPTVGRH